jgi:hypothetical protein
MFHEFAGPLGRLSLRWAGFGSDLDDPVRQLLGVPPESPLESLHFVWKIEFEIEFLLDHLNRLCNGTADGFRCSIGEREAAKLEAE